MKERFFFVVVFLLLQSTVYLHAQNAQMIYDTETSKLDSILTTPPTLSEFPEEENCSFLSEIIKRLVSIQTLKVATRADNKRKLKSILVAAEKRLVINCPNKEETCCEEELKRYKEFRMLNDI